MTIAQTVMLKRERGNTLICKLAQHRLEPTGSSNE